MPFPETGGNEDLRSRLAGHLDLRIPIGHALYRHGRREEERLARVRGVHLPLRQEAGAAQIRLKPDVEVRELAPPIPFISPVLEIALVPVLLAGVHLLPAAQLGVIDALALTGLQRGELWVSRTGSNLLRDGRSHQAEKPEHSGEHRRKTIHGTHGDPFRRTCHCVGTIPKHFTGSISHSSLQKSIAERIRQKTLISKV